MSDARTKKETAANPVAQAAEALAFLARFAARPTQVGALFPSSRELAEEMLDGIDLKSGDIVIEFGPGTGAFTEVVLERLPEGAKYLGIERDPHFHGHLKSRFPGVDFHHGSAEELPGLLSRRGWAKPRLILSGLPFASMPGSVQELILNATREALHEEGEFRTFTYPVCWYLTGSTRFRKVALNHFGEHRKGRTIHRNIPPAKVLSYRKPAKKLKTED
jgi:phospholipid N-methyltransferase